MITETKQALGSWDLTLSPGTPREILDAIDYFGHIAIAPGRFDPRQYGDNLLTSARYVGVFRNRDKSDQYTIRGTGMAFWLGDENSKGDIFENAVVIATAGFPNSIRAVLPSGGAVTEGTLYSVPGTYTGRHQWETPRTAIDYICTVFSTTNSPVEWRVNGNGTLDAGLVTSLYVTTPTALLVSHDAGRDLATVGLHATGKLATDVEDYSTRVVVLGEGIGGSIPTDDATLPSSPYKDIHGNPLVMTKLVSASSTSAGNTAVIAQSELDKVSTPRYAVDLSSDDYDVRGQFRVGDYVMVFDPDNGFYDPAHETYWRGTPINPIWLRCVELSYPIPAGWTVAYRSPNGTWYDLSNYYVGEAGATRIVVGDFTRSVAGIGTEPIGSRPNVDTSVPAAPVFTGSSPGNYQSTLTNTTKAAIRLQWAQPLNIDGSTVLDGDRYEIRYRVNEVIGYTVDWDTLASYSWDDLGTWDALISEPVAASPEWNTMNVGWGTEEATIVELSPGVQYEIQIRAIDAAIPPNFGAFSSSLFVNTVGDLIAPSTPAAPECSTDGRLAIQVRHSLGKNSGGTFNLEQDLDHLDVHVGGSLSFFADDTNRVGKLIATAGMLQTGIPAVGSFTIEPVDTVYVKVIAVDRSGNKSSASPATAGVVDLVDDLHVSDLSVSKLTAGTISTGTIDVASQIRVATGGTVDVTDGQFRVLDTSGNVILRAGVISGRTCMEVLDTDGNIKNRMGQLVDGSYGVESEDPDGNLSSLETLAFGIRAGQVNNAETTASDTFTDLTTYGPEIRVTIGSSARCIVFLNAEIYTGQTGSIPSATGGIMGFVVTDANTGANVFGPSDFESVFYGLDKNNQSAGETVTGSARLGVTVFLDSSRGLYPGDFYFTAKYRRFSATGGNAQFDRRNIVAFPY